MAGIKREDMNYSYHNTTESSGQDLDKYESKAKSQEEIILALMKHMYLLTWTPSTLQVHLRVGYDKHWPITSIRRALSNLTKRNLLRKLDTQCNGPYGRPEHCWSLPAGQQRLF